MLNLEKFECHYGSPKHDAQRNLQGRSYYVTDETLRYHKSRITCARPLCDGLLYGIVESFEGWADGWERPERCFRGVIFSMTGGIVYRPDAGESFGDTASALDAMMDQCGELDAHVINMDALFAESHYVFRAIERAKETVLKTGADCAA